MFRHIQAFESRALKTTTPPVCVKTHHAITRPHICTVLSVWSLTHTRIPSYWKLTTESSMLTKELSLLVGKFLFTNHQKPSSYFCYVIMVRLLMAFVKVMYMYLLPLLYLHLSWVTSLPMYLCMLALHRTIRNTSIDVSIHILVLSCLCGHCRLLKSNIYKVSQ